MVATSQGGKSKGAGRFAEFNLRFDGCAAMAYRDQ